MDLAADTAEQYRDFALDARDYSPCYDDWCTRVADDAEVLAWLDRLPLPKRQPNLVLAAARWHGVPAPGPYDAFRSALLADDGTIVATIRARSTQTNEVGRLATLVPAFALVADRPVALIEVGASAGLNLFPDRYSYAWGGRTIGSGPLLTASVSGDPPLPAAVPSVAWRAGVDLNPLDVTDDDAMRWLSFLVWPEHEERRARLATAVAIARSAPPVLVRGNLLDELPALVATAAAHGPVVVFHSAVAVYLPPEDRDRFQALMTGLVAEGRCHWVSNEAASVLPEVTASGPVPSDARGFVLGIDGRAVALTHGHGAWLRWL
ncbi:DUF2332 domain-containing protein [Nocardioides sp. URHA0032]|uniref:DUF2332 domain-containing protein n=1 Tax=Nocardioides sp. URHA0032 TaxID=1380388 RepID=UPI00048EA3B6|nr:DUF2332 domain-containing protein [Nocardioides sp. URHA0032]